jgi:hypothetical protein
VRAANEAFAAAVRENRGVVREALAGAEAWLAAKGALPTLQEEVRFVRQLSCMRASGC